MTSVRGASRHPHGLSETPRGLGAGGRLLPTSTAGQPPGKQKAGGRALVSGTRTTTEQEPGPPAGPWQGLPRVRRPSHLPFERPGPPPQDTRKCLAFPQVNPEGVNLASREKKPSTLLLKRQRCPSKDGPGRRHSRKGGAGGSRLPGAGFARAAGAHTALSRPGEPAAAFLWPRSRAGTRQEVFCRQRAQG